MDRVNESNVKETESKSTFLVILDNLDMEIEKLSRNSQSIFTSAHLIAPIPEVKVDNAPTNPKDEGFVAVLNSKLEQIKYHNFMLQLSSEHLQKIVRG